MNKLLMLCIALLIATSTACESAQGPSKKEDLKEEIQNSAPNKPQSISSQASAKSGFVRIENPATAQRDKLECSRWTYQENKLTSDLSKMTPAKQEEWGRRCYQFSCAYQGNADMDGKLKTLTVNAGGWIVIADDQGANVQYFISNQILPGFLATCDCCE